MSSETMIAKAEMGQNAGVLFLPPIRMLPGTAHSKSANKRRGKYHNRSSGWLSNSSQPSAFNAESFLLLEFYSGAAGPPGRFSEGFLLRRLQSEAFIRFCANHVAIPISCSISASMVVCCCPAARRADSQKYCLVSAKRNLGVSAMAVSPGGTTIFPDRGIITDSPGNVWSISSDGKVVENGGVDINTARVLQMV